MRAYKFLSFLQNIARDTIKKQEKVSSLYEKIEKTIAKQEKIG